jgi:beta-barrel assembly-enhancing protease
MKKITCIFAFVLIVAIGALAQLGGFFKNLQNNQAAQNDEGNDNKVTKFLKIGQDAGNVLKGVKGIGLQEEMTIGNSVAVQIVSRYGGLVRDPEITRRVNLIGKSLTCYCDRPELSYRFGVLNSSTVNAFSTPGGYVFITRGLYDMVQNDDELAGVLGHEITHVTERHALNIIRRQDFLEGGTDIFAQTGGHDAKRVMSVYSSGIGKITTTLFETGFSQSQEYTADGKGSQLAATVNYAPDGLRQCLQELQKRETPNAAFFPTHPPLQSRIAKLQ